MLAVAEVNLWALLGCEEAFGKGLHLSLAAPGAHGKRVRGNVLLFPSAAWQHGFRGRLWSRRHTKYALKHSLGEEPG